MSEVGPNTSINLDALSDYELQQLETLASTNRNRTVTFVPPFPVAVVVAVVGARAEKALPAILAIHRQLTMTRREWTPLNAAVWRAAGGPSAKKRAAIICSLKQLPDLIRIEPYRTPTSHYRAAWGPRWAGVRRGHL